MKHICYELSGLGFARLLLQMPTYLTKCLLALFSLLKKKYPPQKAKCKQAIHFRNYVLMLQQFIKHLKLTSNNQLSHV